MRDDLLLVSVALSIGGGVALDPYPLLSPASLAGLCYLAGGVALGLALAGRVEP